MKYLIIEFIDEFKSFSAYIKDINLWILFTYKIPSLVE